MPLTASDEDSVNVEGILANFFLKKFEMTDNELSDEKSYRKKSKHKKHKSKKSKHKHRSSRRSSSSDRGKNKVLDLGHTSSSEEKDIKRLKKIKKLESKNPETFHLYKPEIKIEPTTNSYTKVADTIKKILSESYLGLKEADCNKPESKPEIIKKVDSPVSQKNKESKNNSSLSGSEKTSGLTERISKNQEKVPVKAETSSEDMQKISTKSLVEDAIKNVILKDIKDSTTASSHKESEKRHSKKHKRKDSRSRSRSQHKNKSRSRSNSREKSPKTKSRKYSRSNSREKSPKTKSRKYSKSRSRSKDADKKRKRNKSGSRDHSRSRKHSRSRTRRSHSRSKRSRSRHRNSRSNSRHRRSRSSLRFKRSRSRELARHRGRHYKSRSRSRSGHRDRKYSRSRSKDRLDRRRSRSRTRTNRKSRSRSRGKSKNTRIDQAKILELAQKNVLDMIEKGTLPEGLSLDQFKKEQIVSIKSGGKSVQELTDFCTKLSERENDPISGKGNSGDANTQDADTGFIHHPFKLKEQSVIKLNIRNAVQIPVKTHAEKFAETAKLSSQFPVSSGNQHKQKELEWIPVVPNDTSKTAKKTTAESKALVPLGTKIEAATAEPAKPNTGTTVAEPETPVPVTSSSITPLSAPPLPPPMPPPPPPPPPPPAVPPLLPPPPPPPLMSISSTTYNQHPTPFTLPMTSQPVGYPVQRPSANYPAITPQAKTVTITSVSSNDGTLALCGKKDTKNFDISSIVKMRMKALAKLQVDPNDYEAMNTINEAQSNLQEWVESQQVPGLFTGSTDVKLLSVEELSGPRHWNYKVKRTNFDMCLVAHVSRLECNIFLLQTLNLYKERLANTGIGVWHISY